MRLLVLLAVVALASGQRNVATEPCTRPKFKLPVVTNAFAQPFVFFREDSLSYDASVFLGKFGFTDSIALFKPDTSFRKDYIGESEIRSHRDTVGYDGFQLFPDYHQTVGYGDYSYTKSNTWYPVYVVNETNATKAFTAKDSRVFAIQEAAEPGAGYQSKGKELIFVATDISWCLCTQMKV